jgi:hypothetical protein
VRILNSSVRFSNFSVGNSVFPVDFSDPPIENLILPISPSEFLRYKTCSALSVPGDCLGHTGKSTEEIVDMWNGAHPEDMIILESQPEAQPF